MYMKFFENNHEITKIGTRISMITDRKMRFLLIFTPYLLISATGDRGWRFL